MPLNSAEKKKNVFFPIPYKVNKGVELAMNLKEGLFIRSESSLLSLCSPFCAMETQMQRAWHLFERVYGFVFSTLSEKETTCYILFLFQDYLQHIQIRTNYLQRHSPFP